MTLFLSLFAQILHIGLMIAAAPTVAGAMDWLDARFSGRSGPPILLPWRDLLRLSRKTPMTIESVSIVARLTPALGLGATLSAAALVPSFTLGMALSPLADVLVIVSLLTVARLAGGLAALDSGAAPPGLAAQTASARAVLAEPALMLAVVTLALMGGSLNLDQIIGQQREGLLLPAAASAVVMTAMLALVFAEASVPADGLDEMASGIDLAIVRMTAWLRRLVWIDLIGGLFLPVGMAAIGSAPQAWLIGLAVWGIKLGAFILGLCAIQTTLGRVPHRRLPDLIGVAALLALLATIMVLASAGTA
ncbi:NADH-quinone oxidoreductase subunit H [Acidisphaera sp. S103]|uniref:NADH-quinone oxidoreductase subunit H n=1 Tax=Acidisphaera sp. S103 TaxID=1747223 RepID=UPI00131D2745|nr:NADH-quinone oxidoreductase subunit H [Acidisphaera sp. S103]